MAGHLVGRVILKTIRISEVILKGEVCDYEWKIWSKGGGRQWISAVTAGIFLWSGVLAPAAWAQGTPDPVLALPAPGQMVELTEEYTPALLRGLTIHPDNPLAF